MTEHTTHSEEETRKLGKYLAEHHGRAGMCIAFSGELGTGKTVLIRGICEYFACEEQVTSPTFTIINEYTSGTIDIVHCDLYRLASVEEMAAIGLEEVFSDGRLLLVEWAEKALPILPARRVEIASFHGNDDNERVYHVQLYEHGKETILTAPDTFA